MHSSERVGWLPVLLHPVFTCTWWGLMMRQSHGVLPTSAIVTNLLLWETSGCYDKSDSIFSLQRVTHSLTRIALDFIIVCNTGTFQSPSKRKIITLVACFWRKCHKNKFCKGENVRSRTAAEWCPCRSRQHIFNRMCLYSKIFFFFKHSSIFFFFRFLRSATFAARDTCAKRCCAPLSLARCPHPCRDSCAERTRRRPYLWAYRPYHKYLAKASTRFQQ